MFNLMVYADALAEEIQTAEQRENTTNHWADRVATALLGNPGGVIAMLLADTERRGAAKVSAAIEALCDAELTRWREKGGGGPPVLTVGEIQDALTGSGEVR